MIFRRAAAFLTRMANWLRRLFVSARFKNSNDNIDRGLLYVAMTRAEDMLVILHSGASAYIEKLCGFKIPAL
jgi:superfamily I DNA/RNA helicase